MGIVETQTKTMGSDLMILVVTLSMNHRLVILFLKPMLSVGNCPDLVFLKEETMMKTKMEIKTRKKMRRRVVMRKKMRRRVEMRKKVKRGKKRSFSKKKRKDKVSLKT